MNMCSNGEPLTLVTSTGLWAQL